MSNIFLVLQFWEYEVYVLFGEYPGADGRWGRAWEDNERALFTMTRRVGGKLLILGFFCA